MLLPFGRGGKGQPLTMTMVVSDDDIPQTPGDDAMIHEHSSRHALPGAVFVVISVVLELSLIHI